MASRLYTCAISEGGERKGIWICLPRAISARLPCYEVQIICNRCPGLLGDKHGFGPRTPPVNPVNPVNPRLGASSKTNRFPTHRSLAKLSASRNTKLDSKPSMSQLKLTRRFLQTRTTYQMDLKPFSDFWPHHWIPNDYPEPQINPRLLTQVQTGLSVTRSTTWHENVETPPFAVLSGSRALSLKLSVSKQSLSINF